jgi:hypothetical protein
MQQSPGLDAQAVAADIARRHRDRDRLRSGSSRRLRRSPQLESAVLNLALNAQDAMASGGRLSITTANVSLDNQDHKIHPEVRRS